VVVYFVMSCRVQEGTFKVAETTSELQAQRRHNALLEKQLGKAKVDQVPPGVCVFVIDSLMSWIAACGRWTVHLLLSYYCEVCLCTDSVSVCNGPVNQTSLKRLKICTLNLMCMFQETIRT